MRSLMAWVAFTAGCGDAPRCGPESGEAARVIDGDTLELEGGEKVRYLYADTPELGPRECFATEARQANQRWVLGQRLALAYEERCEDAYGRLLARVTTQGRAVHEVLLAEGYARLLVIAPNDAEASHLRGVVRQAQAQGRGLWGACR